MKEELGLPPSPLSCTRQLDLYCVTMQHNTHQPPAPHTGISQFPELAVMEASITYELPSP